MAIQCVGIQLRPPAELDPVEVIQAILRVDAAITKLQRYLAELATQANELAIAT